MVDIIPFVGFSPTSHPMEVIATKSKADISTGPKFRPRRARSGPVNVRMIIPIKPPIKDDVFDTNSA